MDPKLVRLSKKMSYILRHNPKDISIELDDHGWVDFDHFIGQLRTVGGLDIDRLDVIDVILENDKQRFQLVNNRVRAAQGHSVDVDLGLSPSSPPSTLWHGTVGRFVESIMNTGLVPSGRTHVHLSDSIQTATAVASRRGKPLILTIDAESMFTAGHRFFCSTNGVWLTDSVPPEFLST